MNLARTGLAAVCLLVLLAPLTAVQAQEPGFGPAPAEVILSDPAGDVDLTVFARAAPQHVNASQYGGSQVDHLDLLKVRIGGETDASFQVSLQIKVPDAPQGSRPFRFASFSYGRVDWQVLLGGCPLPGQGQQQAPPNTGCLRFRDTGGGYRAVRSMEGARDGNTITWTVGKDWIFNENRVPARWGERLQNLSALAVQNYVGGGGGFGQLDPTGGTYAIDRAPQTGVGAAPFVFQKGAGGRGHLIINAPDPIRVTNGEATTIVYKVDLHNKHSEALDVQVSYRGGESDWSIRVPPLLQVPAGQGLSFPVILSLPFRHDHGKTALFTVQVDAIQDPGSTATTDLGVFWTDVPQPSGHHECDSDDTCGQWFHTSPFDNPAPDQLETLFPFKNVWFNGVPKDPAPNADDANVPAFFNDQFFCMFTLVQNPAGCKVPPTWVASWFFPMSPSLLMGLDYDVSKSGLARLTFVPSAPDPAAAIEVLLLYCDPTKQGGGGPGPFTPLSASCYQYTVLLGAGTVTTSLGPNQPITVEVPLKMEQAADLLPYQRGANIGLSIRVLTTIPQNTILVPPRIEFVTKQSHLHMPLLEYHDPVDQQFAELGAVKLQPLDPFEKPVNAGETTVFRFNVKNDDDDAHHLRLEVQGINQEWAQVGGPQVLLVAPGAVANFSLAVRAPDDAVAEERAELFVVAQSEEEAWVVALSRLRATVVTADVPDEGHLVANEVGTDSPGLGGWASGVCLLAAFWLARRR